MTKDVGNIKDLLRSSAEWNESTFSTCRSCLHQEGLRICGKWIPQPHQRSDSNEDCKRIVKFLQTVTEKHCESGDHFLVDRRCAGNFLLLGQPYRERTSKGNNEYKEV